jgi:hypothetical protein
VAKAQDKEYNLDNTYPIEQNGTIHLNSNDAEVSILGTDRTDVHVVVHREVDIKGLKGKTGDFEMEVKNRGGDLYIRELKNENSTVIFGTIREKYRISIEAPKNVALDIDGDDDNYRISDINLGIKMDCDDSDIELIRARGDNFDFDVDDGSIHMDQGQGQLKLRMSDGKFYTANAHFNEIAADMDDGEIDVTTSLVDDGFYKFDMDDGDVTLRISGGGGRFEINHDDPGIYASDPFQKEGFDEHRTVYRLAGGKARIDIDTDDGDIKLETI